MTHSLRPMALLALPLLLGTAPPPRSSPPVCFDSSRIVERSAPAPDRIEFALAGGQRFASRLSQACSHLAEIDRGYLLVFEEQQGARICGGDRFRLLDPVAARAGGAAGFPWCRFGPLERLPARRR